MALPPANRVALSAWASLCLTTRSMLRIVAHVLRFEEAYYLAACGGSAVLDLLLPPFVKLGEVGPIDQSNFDSQPLGPSSGRRPR